jgi:hypothetical protein
MATPGHTRRELDASRLPRHPHTLDGVDEDVRLPTICRLTPARPASPSRARPALSTVMIFQRRIHGFEQAANMRNCQK